MVSFGVGLVSDELRLCQEVLNPDHAHVEVRQLVLHVLEVVDGTLNLAEQHDDLHGTRQVEVTAERKVDDEGKRIHESCQHVPNDTNYLVTQSDFILLLFHIRLQRQNLFSEVLTPAVELDRAHILERLVSHGVHLLMNLAVLKVQLIELLMQVLADPDGEHQEGNACDEGDADLAEQSVRAVDERQGSFGKVAQFPDKANEATSLALDTMNLAFLVVLARCGRHSHHLLENDVFDALLSHEASDEVVLETVLSEVVLRHLDGTSRAEQLDAERLVLSLRVLDVLGQLAHNHRQDHPSEMV